ncbi:hypothetical protein DTA24_06470 [Klebsiella sp. P1CD1]|nr:hypothetical protein DTA24_06470 [Klebsiella sp. P1CD1]
MAFLFQITDNSPDFLKFRLPSAPGVSPIALTGRGDISGLAAWPLQEKNDLNQIFAVKYCSSQ